MTKKEPEVPRIVSTDEAFGTVQVEGLGAALLNFYHHDRFEDHHLQRLWDAARYSMAKVERYLEQTAIAHLDDSDDVIDWMTDDEDERIDDV